MCEYHASVSALLIESWKYVSFMSSLICSPSKIPIIMFSTFSNGTFLHILSKQLILYLESLKTVSLNLVGCTIKENDLCQVSGITFFPLQLCFPSEAIVFSPILRSTISETDKTDPEGNSPSLDPQKLTSGDCCRSSVRPGQLYILLFSHLSKVTNWD